MRRRLDVELVRRGLLESRTRAAAAIAGGQVLVAGMPARSPAHQVTADVPIVLRAAGPRFVSRGGEKLDAALEALGVDVSAKRVLDAGASTGGFTDCLLRRDAAHVYAVDVGRGQLAWSMRTNPRVSVLERTNLRYLDPAALGGPVPVAVADLAFISLLTVAPSLVRCTTGHPDLVLLVKPQFEAGRSRVGKGGVIRDPEVHAAVVVEVASGLAEAGLPVVDAMTSPVLGADGNREFFVRCAKKGSPVRAERLEELAHEEQAGAEPGIVVP